MAKLKFILLLILTATSNFSQEKNTNVTIYKNSTSPLFVINDIIVNELFLKKIPEKNIKSVVVLKDKEATLKYNELGKNGAILITTKGISKKKLNKLHNLYTVNADIDSIHQIKTIVGTVTDCEYNPLPNVYIKNINTNTITTSDSIGKFRIEANKMDIILFSKPSHQTQQYQFNNKKEITIILKEIPEKPQIILEKPVIYLYPKEKTDIELSINFNGKLLTTFPKLDKSWKVKADENGQLFDKKTNRFYTSLFWDGQITFPATHYEYKTGFVVEKEKLTSFLIEKLEFMGLNNNETNDFLQYWLPVLERNNYTFIHFLVNDEYRVFSTNNVNPKPDTSIRIFMEFFGTEEPFSVAPQELTSTKRNGFTLVEWGGSDVSKAINRSEFLNIN